MRSCGTKLVLVPALQQPGTQMAALRRDISVADHTADTPAERQIDPGRCTRAICAAGLSMGGYIAYESRPSLRRDEAGVT
jgi:hypothetical protein